MPLIKFDDRGKSNLSSIFGQGLVFTCLNINSLLTHELRVLISASKVDILGINESTLDSAVHNNEVYLRGFELVRKDPKIKGRNGGRVCIYLRTNLSYRKRDELSNDK